jgi:D-xylose transport system substrate-binding protein
MPIFRKLFLCTAFAALSFSATAQKVGLLMASFISDRWYLDQKHFSDRVQVLGGECIVDVSYSAVEQMERAKKMIEEGVKVLVIIAVDGTKGADIVAYAKSKNVPVICYDRLILSSDVTLYVSFDNVKVGRLQAEYALKRVPRGNYFLINGPTSDYSAVSFRKGQLAGLQASIDAGEVKIVQDVVMDSWSEMGAFETMKDFVTSRNDIPQVVIAANDALANGVISALPSDRLGKVVVVGQDADLSGLRNIVSGNQAMTVYKPIKELAYTAAEKAVQLANGEALQVTSRLDAGDVTVSAILLEPFVVDMQNYRETVVKDGHTSLSEVVKNLGKAFEKEHNRIQMSLLEKEKALQVEQKEYQRKMFIYITIFLVFSIAGLSYTIFQKQRDNKLLNDQKIVIERKNQELQKINDQLKNLNDELTHQKEEISSQRDAIAGQKGKLEEVNTIMSTQRDEIMRQNERLGIEVQKRTQELTKYIRQLEQYSFVTAHNLRAPVARLIGLSTLVKMQHAHPEELEFIIDKLVLTSEELDLVFRELNAILDIRTFSMEIFSNVNIPEAFVNIRGTLSSEIKHSHAIIHAEFEVKMIFSIKPYIESILFNLLSNSIKYREPSRVPVIHVKTEKCEGRVLLSVSDNGLGIDTSYMDKIFQLYKRFHFHVEGRGIGLFLIKTQVDSLGGRIEIESAVNQGTTVKIWLDLPES